MCMRAMKRRAPGCLGLGHRGSKTPLCYRVYCFIILYPIIGIPITTSQVFNGKYPSRFFFVAHVGLPGFLKPGTVPEVQ